MNEVLNETSIFIFKSIILIIVLYAVFNYGLIIKDKIMNYVYKLPKPVLYVIMTILIILMIVIKYFQFGFDE